MEISGNKRFGIYIVAICILASSCQTEVDPYEVNNVGPERLSFSVSFENKANPITKSIVSMRDTTGYLTPFEVELEVGNSSGASMDVQLTKGTPIESVSSFMDKFETFKVWGYQGSNLIDRSGVKVFNGQVVKKYGQATYCPYDGEKFLNYYPLGTVTNPRFFAMVPESPVGTVGSFTVNSGSMSFNYTMPVPDPDNNCDAQSQQEILLGTLNGEVTDTNVPILFKHPLSTVRFVVGDIQRDVTIDMITLKDIYSYGSCSINSAGTITWSNQKTSKSYTQTFAYPLTTTSVVDTEINDEEKTKTFMTIPHKLPNSAAIVLTYTDEYGHHEANFSLEGTTWEPDNTYTYTIKNFNFSTPWVDFPNYSKSAGQEFKNASFAVDDYIRAIYGQIGGEYEKMNIPIRNCQPGTWYVLSFHENIEKTGSNYYNDRGLYGCRIFDSPYTTTTRAGMLTWYDGADDSNTPFRYVWVCDERLWDYDNYSHPTSKDNPAQIIFQATSETMYWVWDYSKLNDGSDMDIAVWSDGIQPFAIATEPAVDFLNASHCGFRHTWMSDGDGIEIKAYSTYKTMASYEAMEFHARPFDSDKKYPRLNIPLINLTVGQKYRLTFTLDRTYGTSSTSGTDRYFGYRISDNPSVTTDKYTPAAEDDFQDRSVNCGASVFTLSESYDFEATNETMYWIFEMSKLPQNKVNDFQFTNVSISPVSR